MKLAASLPPERLDRIESRRLPRRIEAEEDADQPGNADGDQDIGDLGLENWRIYVDANGNDAYDVGEAFDLSDEFGAGEERRESVIVPAGTSGAYAWNEDE